ncbi:MAG: DUF3179 domain-containing protein [Phycisphaerae bacterium]|nr:DUF3179 domain-containing protein [Phycisphaerae bacterium]
MLLPILLIGGAVFAAAVTAYGMDPELAQFNHGIQIITISRRLEWPLIIISLALCVALLGLIITGRRRAWWAIGLGVVLALFVRGLSSIYRPPITLLESPPMVEANKAQPFVAAQEYVVGFRMADKYFALPYHQLAAFPLVMLSDFDQRALVIWSATANAAIVLPLDRDASPRELEVVSTPADSLLLFDRKLGQFIVGVTGRTVAGRRPIGMGDALPVEKMPFDHWANAHPDTRVMAVVASSSLPMTPLLPRLHFPIESPDSAQRRVSLLATTQPAAIPNDATFTGTRGITVGKTVVLLMRESAVAPLRAFDRQAADDLFLTFAPVRRPDKKRPTATLKDAESGSFWTNQCKAIDGPLKGTQLREIPIRHDLYWGVMKFWMPDLQLIDVK